MSLFDDEPLKPVSVHQIGQDLSLLSVEDLETRIDQLRTEIDRLDAELKSKGSSRLAAEALFRRG